MPDQNKYGLTIEQYVGPTNLFIISHWGFENTGGFDANSPNLSGAGSATFATTPSGLGRLVMTLNPKDIVYRPAFGYDMRVEEGIQENDRDGVKSQIHTKMTLQVFRKKRQGMIYGFHSAGSAF